MAGLTPAHLLIIMVVALIVVGPGKLPEVGAAIGRSVREFQRATSGITDTVTGALTGTMAPPANAPQPTQPAPPAQSYYAAGPAYPAPGAPAPVNYPVMGAVQPAPGAPAPAAPAEIVPVDDAVPSPTDQ